jgi:Copper chaperone PCu(A)C
MRQVIVTTLAVVVAACGGQTAAVTIENAQYRPPLVDGGSGVAYFSITSRDADRIVGVSSPLAKAVEIHESRSIGGMVGMERREVVDLAAGKPVIFGPSDGDSASTPASDRHISDSNRIRVGGGPDDFIRRRDRTVKGAVTAPKGFLG